MTKNQKVKKKFISSITLLSAFLWPQKDERIGETNKQICCLHNSSLTTMNDNNEKFWNRREAEAELIIERLVEAGMEWKVMTAGSFACRFWLL